MRVTLTLMLLVVSSFAQIKPDFSGVFLRTETRFRDKAEPAVPRVIEVSQTAEVVRVTATQNLETATVDYRLKGDKQGKAEARLKGQNLLVRSTTEVHLPSLGPFWPGSLLTQSLEEKWELSPDGKQLKIHRKYGGSSGEDIDIYDREPSRYAALAAAATAGQRACGAGRSFRSLRNQRQGAQTYQQGYELGLASLQRITRCVTYDAALSGDSFRNLVRIKDQQGSHFLRTGQAANAFDGDVILEVEPHPYACPGEAGIWTQTAVPPESSLDLRFMVRWLGSERRDLGEVQSEFRYEPWRESSNPVAFYRMRVPAQGIPLSDDLEVTIFSKTGEQLACIKGHL
jgi:hypothetical protein